MPPLAAPPKIRYEYKVIETYYDPEKKLNVLGALGWRVVAVTRNLNHVILEREAQ